MNILELGYLDVGNYIHGILNARTHELEHKAKSRRENYCRGGGKQLNQFGSGVTDCPYFWAHYKEEKNP